MDSISPRFVLLLLTLAAGSPAAATMRLGSNFWNLRWHAPDDCFSQVQAVDPSSPWNPTFLREIEIYRALRFMDWDAVNNSERERWGQRTRRDSPDQRVAAYEWMIDLCNRTRADLWVCLPHRVVSAETGANLPDYALKLALLIRTGVDMGAVDLTPHLGRLGQLDAAALVELGGSRTCAPLDPSLSVFVEYSNETWNGMFSQATYTCEQGVKLGIDRSPAPRLDAKGRNWTAGHRFHAWASARIFQAFRQVWGEDRRLVTVLAGHTGNPGMVREHLAVLEDPSHNPWNVRLDAYALAPYVGHKVNGALADWPERMHAELDRVVRQVEQTATVCREKRLRLIAYEGGQHLKEGADLANRDPRMHAFYLEYLRRMEPFFDTFCHYAHVGQAGPRNAWGAIEKTGDDPAKAHRYRALRDFANGSFRRPPDT